MASTRPQVLLAGLTIGLSTLGSLALSELGLRLFHFGPQAVPVEADMFRLSPDALLGYELRPGAPDVDGAINSDGIRDREYAERKSAGVFRVAMIGDSVVFGEGVRQADTMSEILERLLNGSRPASEPAYDVINFGVVGYNSEQVARQLVRTVGRYGPDLVIYVYSLNDPEDWDPIIHELAAKLSPAERRMFESAWRHAHSAFARLRLYQLGTAALDTLRSARSRLPTRASRQSVDEEWHAILTGTAARFYARLYDDPRRWGRTTRDLGAIASETHQLGSRLVVVLSPMLEGYADRYPLGGVHRRLADLCRSLGASVLDLAPAAEQVRKTRTLGFDVLHYSAPGHRFAALEIANFLVSEGLLPETGETTGGSRRFSETDIVDLDDAPK